MAGKKVLVPFNFTDYDEKALHYVIRSFADQKWVTVTLFHAYTPLPELDGYSNPGLGRLKATMASLWKEHREREVSLKKAIEDLQDNGFSSHQLDYVFKARVKDIGGEIVDLAQKEGYDTVVLSHRQGNIIRRSFTRSVHDKVLSTLKNRTISIIT